MVNLKETTSIAGHFVIGPVMFLHDDARMARGEPCTSVHRFIPGKGPGEEIVAFHCKPRWTKAPREFTAAVAHSPYGPRVLKNLLDLIERDAARRRPLLAARHAALDFVVQLRGHLDKEENLLFPALPFSTVLYPIRVMESDHLRLEAALDHLRHVLHGLDGLDRTGAWHGCVARLADLDAAVRAHHRRENERLFPLALEVERRLP